LETVFSPKIMEITMSENVLRAMLQDAAELGSMAVLVRHGLVKSYISKQDAYNMYGRRIVDRWILEKLITPLKDGQTSSKWRINSLQIESIAKASNRPSYRSVLQRRP
jgi:hypothetical protein